MLDGIHEKLKSVSNAQTRTGTMRCVRSICHQYLSPSLKHLLSKPLPWDRLVLYLNFIIQRAEQDLTGHGRRPGLGLQSECPQAKFSDL